MMRCFFPRLTHLAYKTEDSASTPPIAQDFFIVNRAPAELEAKYPLEVELSLSRALWPNG